MGISKNRLLSVIGILLVVALVAVCGVLLMLEKSPAAEFQHASMLVVSDTVSPTGMKYTIENRAETCVGYGEEYHIEEKTLWGWKEAEQKGDLFWHAVLYEIPPHGSQECEVRWESVYGVLPPGTYRLVKTIRVNNEKYTAAAEFSIP